MDNYSLNINRVECKFVNEIKTLLNKMSLNINRVECKCKFERNITI